MASSRQAWGWRALQVALVAAAMAALYDDALPYIGSRVFGDAGGGDPALVLMQLKWPADYLLGRTPAFIRGLASFPIYYPYANSFSLSDAMLGNQPIWFPLYALTGNPIVATNVWVLICTVLNYLCFSWYLRSWSFLDFVDARSRRWLSLLGGMFFAFAGFRLDNHFHLQLFPQFWTPLALLCLDRAVVFRRLRHFLLLAVILAMQWLSGTYLGLMAFVLVAVAAIVSIASRPARAPLIGGVALSILATLLLLLPSLLDNLEAVRMGLYYAKDLAAAYGTGLTGFIGTVPWNHAPLALGICVPSHSSMSLFPGIALSLLMLGSCAAAAIRRPGSLLCWGSGALAAVLLVLATGESHLVELLPLYSVIRVPARLSLAALVPGLVFVVCALYVAVPERRRSVVVVAALAILWGELLWREVPSRPFPREPDPEFERVLGLNGLRPLLLLPQTVGQVNNLERVRISQAQMELLSHRWVPGLAGRSGPRPQFVNAVIAHSLDMLSVPSDAASFIERARLLGYAGIAVMNDLDPGHRAALSTVLGRPRYCGEKYCYFPLYDDPSDAPPSQRLDAGQAVVEAVGTERIVADIVRVDPRRIRVVLKPRAPLSGVVQRRRDVHVPYRLTSPTNETTRGSAVITLDAVTDRPDLSFLLSVPAEPGWSIVIADSSYWIPPPPPRK